MPKIERINGWHWVGRAGARDNAAVARVFCGDALLGLCAVRGKGAEDFAALLFEVDCFFLVVWWLVVAGRRNILDIAGLLSSDSCNGCLRI